MWGWRPSGQGGETESGPRVSGGSPGRGPGWALASDGAGPPLAVVSRGPWTEATRPAQPWDGDMPLASPSTSPGDAASPRQAVSFLGFWGAGGRRPDGEGTAAHAISSHLPSPRGALDTGFGLVRVTDHCPPSGDCAQGRECGPRPGSGSRAEGTLAAPQCRQLWRGGSPRRRGSGSSRHTTHRAAGLRGQEELGPGLGSWTLCEGTPKPDLAGPWRVHPSSMPDRLSVRSGHADPGDAEFAPRGGRQPSWPAEGRLIDGPQLPREPRAMPAGPEAGVSPG